MYPIRRAHSAFNSERMILKAGVDQNVMLEIAVPDEETLDPQYNVRPEEFIVGPALSDGTDYDLGSVAFKEPNIHGTVYSDNGSTGAGDMKVHMDLTSVAEPGERADAVTNESGDFYLYKED